MLLSDGASLHNRGILIVCFSCPMLFRLHNWSQAGLLQHHQILASWGGLCQVVQKQIQPESLASPNWNTVLVCNTYSFLKKNFSLIALWHPLRFMQHIELVADECLHEEYFNIQQVESSVGNSMTGESQCIRQTMTKETRHTECCDQQSGRAFDWRSLGWIRQHIFARARVVLH